MIRELGVGDVLQALDRRSTFVACCKYRVDSRRSRRDAEIAKTSPDWVQRSESIPQA